MAELIFTDRYNKRAKKFIKRHLELISQYEKTLKLMELNPFHSSLRIHKLHGKLSELYSVSINISYRISIIFLIEDDKIIPVDVGRHDDVY